MAFPRNDNQTAIRLTSTLTRSPHVTSTTERGETVLLDLGNGKYHVLNEVGTRLWELVAKGATFDSIVQVIRAEYALPLDAPSDLVERDVSTLIVRLRDLGLLVIDQR